MNTIEIPASFAALMTSSSFTEPPGWITALAPNEIVTSKPSANGKNASDATTEFAREFSSDFSISLFFCEAILALSIRLIWPAPIPIVFYIASNSSLSNLQQGLVLSAFLFWALRLTYNWFLNWTNLEHEDFRYIDLKNTNRLLAFVNDLFGIHLIPTLIVNASLYPIYVALTSDYLNNLVYHQSVYF